LLPETVCNYILDRGDTARRNHRAWRPAQRQAATAI